MRLATWNINGLRARLDFVLHWLAAREPDVVGLQELKLPNDQFPHMAFEALGYQAIVHGQKAWNGVAVLSRQPAEQLQAGLPGQAEAGARLLTVRVGGIDFTTVYCPNGKNIDHPDFPRKLAWFDALDAHFEARLASADSTAASVLCGDFNICPAAIDSWNPERMQGHIFHTEAERERFDRLVSRGLADIFRTRHPQERLFSWWDYRGGAFHRKMGLRIDLILGTSNVAERTREIWIDREYRKKQDGMTASDHAPVILDLDDA